jgi:hypothetical protein
LSGNWRRLRGASTIDGFHLTPDDDVCTGRVTSVVAGRHHADGSFDPLFDDLHVWVARRHHFMEPQGCDKMGVDDSCRPCAAFYDYVYFFTPSLGRDASRYAANLPSEVTTGTEASEVATQGMKPCR